MDLTRTVVGGLGVTGQAVVRALKTRGHEVIAIDDRPELVSAIATQLEVKLVSGTSETEVRKVLSDASTLILSPGIPEHHPINRIAGVSDLEILSELDLGAQWDERPRIAITGTNGKTTVTHLVREMLCQSGLSAIATGNSEVPFADAVQISPEDCEMFVVEASSFDLERVRYFRSDAAAWLNLSPDHLDWHGDFESYASAKAKIFQGQRASDFAVLPVKGDSMAPWLPQLEAQLVTFGLSEGDVCFAGDHLVAHGEQIIAISDLPLSRPHDLLNAAAASALAKLMGVSGQAIGEALSEFEGLGHRMEYLKTIGGIRFFNDSKATTPHATIAGVSGLRNSVLIAGGRNKGLDLTLLETLVPLLDGVVAIGECAEEVSEVFKGALEVLTATSMEEAVRKAMKIAASGNGNIILSPACASFDWYQNYEQRGDDFRQIVGQMVKEYEAR